MVINEISKKPDEKGRALYECRAANDTWKAFEVFLRTLEFEYDMPSIAPGEKKEVIFFVKSTELDLLRIKNYVRAMEL